MAYARFDHRPPALLPALAAEVRRKLPLFSPQVRATCLHPCLSSCVLKHCAEVDSRVSLCKALVVRFLWWPSHCSMSKSRLC